MDRGFVYTCVLLLFTAATLGCAGGQQTIEGEITFEQLFSNPGAYNGRYIILEGFYFHGWEISVLCETLELSGYA